MRLKSRLATIDDKHIAIRKRASFASL